MDIRNSANVFYGIDFSKIRTRVVYDDYYGGEATLYDFTGAYTGKVAVANGVRFVTDFIYDATEQLREFVRNDIVAVKKDGKWGIVNKYGNIVAPFVFDHAISIDNDTAFAKYNGRYGILDMRRTTVTPQLGAVLGNVLNTDVTAYINGQQIPTYTIGTRTFIAVEDLERYGFDVAWNRGDRSLRVEWNANKSFNPLSAERNTRTPGSVRGVYIYTDIKTYLSGREVEAFNMQGRTIIDFELLSRYGSISWNSELRRLRLWID